MASSMWEWSAMRSSHLHNDVLLQHRIHHRINVFINVLKQEWKPILDGKLQLLQGISIIEALHLAFKLFALTPLDPCHCLSQAAPRSVFHREIWISWQSDSKTHANIAQRLKVPWCHVHTMLSDGILTGSFHCEWQAGEIGLTLAFCCLFTRADIVVACACALATGDEAKT